MPPSFLHLQGFGTTGTHVFPTSMRSTVFFFPLTSHAAWEFFSLNTQPSQKQCNEWRRRVVTIAAVLCISFGFVLTANVLEATLALAIELVLSSVPVFAKFYFIGSRA